MPLNKMPTAYGNYYDKYRTRNPISHWLMQNFLKSFDKMAKLSGAQSALEIGCGEGELTRRMAQRGIQISGCDISEEVIEIAKQRTERKKLSIDFWTSDIMSLDQHPPCELIVCCEVLEHVHNPDSALEILARLANPFLLTSVPREPLWRLLNMVRGSYLANFGNTPGHINHWNTKSFLTFLQKRFDIVQIQKPLPWTMVLCKSLSKEFNV